MTDAVLGTTMATPVGDLALLVHDDTLVAAGFSSVDDQYSRLRAAPPLRRVDDLGRFTEAMTAYFAGDVTAMDTLPVDQTGGPFRQAAWKVMREVRPGEVITSRRSCRVTASCGPAEASAAITTGSMRRAGCSNTNEGPSPEGEGPSTGWCYRSTGAGVRAPSPASTSVAGDTRRRCQKPSADSSSITPAPMNDTQAAIRAI
jgi:methylated-DNA-[protein]-cysteine S-methyltransferase